SKGGKLQFAMARISGERSVLAPPFKSAIMTNPPLDPSTCPMGRAPAEAEPDRLASGVRWLEIADIEMEILDTPSHSHVQQSLWNDGFHRTIFRVLSSA
ncbi:MAG: hypothetical protein OXH85_06250, partial [Truepera sp.]|nr:hypothetical protein [Truepera sp.]